MAKPRVASRAKIARFRLGADPDVACEGRDGFDELVVGDWLHLERMDRRVWWIRIGDFEADIVIARDGSCRVVER